MEKLNIDDVHHILFGIACNFHDLCERYEIPYYMLGGTMLGAIRHGGFIPWDDDMDFGVPREFFDKLIYALKELPPQYSAISIDNNDNICTGVIKIVDNRTIIKEINKRGRNSELNVFIDIFPLDKANGNFGPFSRNGLINTLLRIQNSRFSDLSHHRTITKKLKGIIIKSCFFWLRKKTIVRIVERLTLRKDAGYLANYYGMWQQRETMLKHIYGTPKLYVFETTHFYGVENPDNYLKNLYGKYKEIPPEHERHIHISEVYKK